MRNAYAHRGGVADRRARAACPWRKDWKLGKPILVNHSEYERHCSAITEYAFALVVRTAAKFGVDARERAKENAGRFSDGERKKRQKERRRPLAAAKRRIAAEERAKEDAKAKRTIG